MKIDPEHESTVDVDLEAMFPSIPAPATMRTVDDTAGVAAYVNMPTKTLEHWRHIGTGPPFIRMGKRVRYRKVDVDAWLEAHTTQPRQEVGHRGAPAA